MSAREILMQAAGSTGWNKSSMLAIALEYIDNQHDDDAFEEFVRSRAEEEASTYEEDDE